MYGLITSFEIVVMDLQMGARLDEWNRIHEYRLYGSG